MSKQKTSQKTKVTKPTDPNTVREKALKDTYTLMVYAAIDDLNSAVPNSQKQFQSTWFASYTNITKEHGPYEPKLTPITVCNAEIPQVFRQIMEVVIEELSKSEGADFLDRINGTQEHSLCKIGARINDSSITLEGTVLADAPDHRNTLLASLGGIDRDLALHVVGVMMYFIKGFARTAACTLWHGIARGKKATVSTSMLFDWLSDKFAAEEQHYRQTIHGGMRPKAKKAAPVKSDLPADVPLPPHKEIEVAADKDAAQAD